MAGSDYLSTSPAQEPVRKDGGRLISVYFRYQRFILAAAFLLAAGLCALSLSQSALFFVDTPYDIYIPLNAGLRWLEGAWPSRDYPSPIGFIYAATHGLILSFDSNDARSVVRADVAVLLFSCLLLRPNMRGLPTAIQAITVLLLAGMMMTPLALDSSWGSYRYVADYNRWAWALYAVVLAWTCNPLARTLLARIAVAVALCCLLYLKLTIFAGAVLTLAAGCFNGRRISDFGMPLAAIVLAVAAGIAGGVFLPYIADNISAAQATNSARFGKFILQLFVPYNSVALLLGIAVCFVAELPKRLRFLPLYCMFIQHAMALQNFDEMVPLSGLPLLFLMPRLTWSKPQMLRPILVGAPALFQAGYIFVVAALALSLQSHMSVLANARSVSAPQTLGEKLLISTLPAAGFGTGGGDLPYADDVIVHDMQRAQDLMAQLPEGTRVATLDVTNIAAAAWPRLRPSSGGLLWYDDGRSYSDAAHPAPAEVFAGADIVLVPLHFTTASARKLVALYQPWLDRCASVVAANELWRLYQPRSGKIDGQVPEAQHGTAGASSRSPTDDLDCSILARP